MSKENDNIIPLILGFIGLLVLIITIVIPLGSILIEFFGIFSLIGIIIFISVLVIIGFWFYLFIKLIHL